ncbi:hypothetical protein XA68_16383 [Ophiocordyceps unilateralis]|uniref:Cytochrome b mRNA-processing protein 4 n=1 Tax=Ophiocordyceps unilateralis TaxID=268505 RepID=A0A2A9PLJ4_OPHUN|nr:hypothetical protein XA68_16383 [Ophiocordyceps unilateralis]
MTALVRRHVFVTSNELESPSFVEGGPSKEVGWDVGSRFTAFLNCILPICDRKTANDATPQAFASADDHRLIFVFPPPPPFPPPISEFSLPSLDEARCARRLPMARINWSLWAKVLIGGTLVSVGGPALTMYLTPTEEELRSRYNPDLRKKSLETREERQQEFNDFVTQLKTHSKSDKPIWIAMKEDEQRRKQAALEAGRTQQREADACRDEMRREAGLGSK